MGTIYLDGESQPASGAPAAMTRREWVVAASGLVLAGGGLVLPAWRADADAREGAYGGQLGGRHGPNQRGRDKSKRRGRGDRKGGSGRSDREQAKPPGSSGITDCALTISNNLCCTAKKVPCTFYYRTERGPLDYSPPIEALTKSVGRGESHRFASGQPAVGLLFQIPDILYAVYIEVGHPSGGLPLGFINRGAEGERLDPPNDRIGEDWLPSRLFSVGSSASRAFYILRRNADTAHTLEFEVTFL